MIVAQRECSAWQPLDFLTDRTPNVLRAIFIVYHEVLAVRSCAPGRRIGEDGVALDCPAIIRISCSKFEAICFGTSSKLPSTTYSLVACLVETDRAVEVARKLASIKESPLRMYISPCNCGGRERRGAVERVVEQPNAVRAGSARL